MFSKDCSFDNYLSRPLTIAFDLQVGAKGLETGVFGAYCNVMINLKEIKDESYLCSVSFQICIEGWAMEIFHLIYKLLIGDLYWLCPSGNNL